MSHSYSRRLPATVYFATTSIILVRLTWNFLYITSIMTLKQYLSIYSQFPPLDRAKLNLKSTRYKAIRRCFQWKPLFLPVNIYPCFFLMVNMTKNKQGFIKTFKLWMFPVTQKRGSYSTEHHKCWQTISALGRLPKLHNGFYHVIFKLTSLGVSSARQYNLITG